MDFESLVRAKNELMPRVEQLCAHLDAERKLLELEQIEEQTAAPGFWDSPEAAKPILKRRGGSFDPIRREVARQAILKLLADGRIHPARIEEVVEKTKIDMDLHLKELGEAAAIGLGFPDVHPKLHKLIGRLNYRTSYGQNVLDHTKEVAHIAEYMAAELGADQRLARRAGLFHDIGKAIDREVEGTHIEIGMELLKRFGEKDNVIHAMS